MLAFFLLVHAWSLVNSVILFSGYLIKVPWLYRTGSPAHYLIPVAAWLYVRVSLGQELRLRKGDWWLFLPAILHFLEMLPFYLMPYDQKLALIQNNYKTYPEIFLRFQEGILLPYAHSYIKITAALVSAAFQWNFYRQWKRHAPPAMEPGFGRWLFFFISAYTVFCLSVIPSLLGFLGAEFLGLSDMILAFFLLIASTVLFFYPRVLYGIEVLPPFPIERQDEHVHDSGVKAFELPPDLLYAYKVRLDELMNREQPFRKQGYTIRQMSEELHIPVHHISLVLNREYRLNFSEYINRQRINFLLQQFEQPGWRVHTMESLAADAGFSARNTFFIAFKKTMGVSPSEYLRSRRELMY